MAWSSLKKKKSIDETCGECRGRLGARPPAGVAWVRSQRGSGRRGERRRGRGGARRRAERRGLGFCFFSVAVRAGMEGKGQARGPKRATAAARPLAATASDCRRARPLPYVCIKKRSPTPAHFCFLSQQWPLRFEQVGVDVRVSTSLASCKARRRETLRTQAPRARLSPPGAPEPRGPEVLRAAGEGRCGPRPRPRLCSGGPGAATGRGRAAGTRPWRDLPCPRRLNRGRRRIIPGHFSETYEHDLFLTVSYYPGLGRDF